MAHERFDAQTQSVHNADGHVIQVGRDYTRTSNMRIGVWISITVVGIVAIASSARIRLLQGENRPTLEIQLQEESAAEIRGQ